MNEIRGYSGAELVSVVSRKYLRPQQSKLMSFVETLTRQVVVFLAAGAFTVWWFNEVESFWYGLWKSWPYVVGAFGIGYFIRRIFARWG